jgi:chemotaxis protein MotB
MRRTVLTLALAAITLTSCGAKKKIAALEAQNKECQDMLNSATVKLNTCLAERDGMAARIEDLKKANENLTIDKNNFALLSSKGAENIEKTLGSTGFRTLLHEKTLSPWHWLQVLKELSALTTRILR